MLQIELIDHVALTVSDIDTSTAWYARVFDMMRIYEDVWTGSGDPVALCNGTACVALFRNRHNEQLPTEPERGGRHFAFKVDRGNYDKMKKRLEELGVEFKERDHKVCNSLYLNDPDGYQIEVTYYYE